MVGGVGRCLDGYAIDYVTIIGSAARAVGFLRMGEVEGALVGSCSSPMA